MSGFLTFMDRYRDEAACIAALAELRWPRGFVCAGCAGRLAYQLTVRPRVFECAGCGQQHSVTAGTVFHRTRTPLRKWFAAAWLIGQDKRGVSALGSRAGTALRHGLADGAQAAPRTERAAGIPPRRPTGDRRELLWGSR